MSAVFAGENISSDSVLDLNDNTEVDNPIYNEKADDLLSDDGNIDISKNFHELNEVINESSDSEIILSDNYKYDSENDEDFINGIHISRNLTIDGSNKTVIDGSNLARIFYIEPEVTNFTLKNIIIQNSYTSNNGSAIYITGLTNLFLNATFKNNVANNFGGVVDISGDDYDGIIYLDGLFKNNQALSGGVISFEKSTSSKSKLFIRGCYLNNSVQDNGGVIYFEESINNTLDINATFISNSATIGSIFQTFDVESSSNFLIDGLYINNSASSGAVVWVNDIFTDVFVYGTYINNSADDGIFKAKTKNSGYNIKIMDSSNFTDNAVLNIVYTDYTFSDLNNLIKLTPLDYIVLDRNYTYDQYYDLNFYKGVPITRSITLDGQGKVVIDGRYIARCLRISANLNVVLKNLCICNGFSNQAIGKGAGINVDDNVNLVIDNCVLKNHKIYNVNGGAISANCYTNIKIINSLFINNTSIRESDLAWSKFKAGMGCVIYAISGSNISFINTTITSNNAYLTVVLVVSYYGNSLLSTSTLNMDNCILDSNNCTAGGIVYSDEFGKSNITNSIFSNNNGPHTLSLDSSVLAVVDNCSFINNSGTDGVGIYIGRYDEYTKSNVTILNTKFINNYASGRGGAIRSTNGVVKIDSCYFENNTAEINGGAVFSNLWEVNITNSEFINNVAKDNGGAIYGASSSDFNIFNSIFINSTSNQNNGITLLNKKNLTDNWWGSNNPSYSIGSILKVNSTITLFSKINNNYICFIKTTFYNKNLLIINTAWERPLIGENIRGNFSIGYWEGETKPDSINFNVDNQKISLNINNDPSFSFKTLQDIINLYDKNEFSLNDNFTYNESSDSELRDGIIINKSIVINGNDFTISGNNIAKRIFNITSDDVLLENISLINTLNEGAVISGNNNIISNINLIDTGNTGINVKGINITINNLTLDNSTSAINATGDNITINGADINNVNGTALNINSGTSTVVGVNINNVNGTALNINCGNLNIYDVNVSDVNGTALYVKCENLTVSNTCIENSENGIIAEANMVNISKINLINITNSAIDLNSSDVIVDNISILNASESIKINASENVSISNVDLVEVDKGILVNASGNINMSYINTTAVNGNVVDLESKYGDVNLENVFIDDCEAESPINIKSENGYCTVKKITLNNVTSDYAINIESDSNININNIFFNGNGSVINAASKNANITISNITLNNYTEKSIIAIAPNGIVNITDIHLIKANDTEPLILDADKVFNINTKDSKNPKFSIKLPNNATGTFTVKVDGKIIENLLIKDGKANTTIYDLDAGKHIVELLYSGDANYSNLSKKISIKVLSNQNNTTKNESSNSTNNNSNIKTNNNSSKRFYKQDNNYPINNIISTENTNNYDDVVKSNINNKSLNSSDMMLFNFSINNTLLLTVIFILFILFLLLLCLKRFRN